MVNANHGDCNVVDLCRVRIANGAYVPDPDNKMSYSRSIIDVGPNKATLKALEAVLTNVGQPKFTVPHSGNVSTPIGYDEALVDMLQVGTSTFALLGRTFVLTGEAVHAH